MTDQERTPAFSQKKTQDNIITLYGLNRRARTPFSLPVAPFISSSGVGGTGGNATTNSADDPTIRNSVDHGTIGLVTEIIDLSTIGGNTHRMVLNGDVGLAFDNPPINNKIQRFVLHIVMDVVGGHVITWPAALVNPPTIDNAANAVNRF